MNHEIEDDLSIEELEELEAELAVYAEEEAQRMGLGRDQYVENVQQTFTADQRADTTLLVSGLSLAHDQLVTASLAGIGYKVETLEVPNTESLQYGKEFGNRGQCSPTYFTVGNLVKHLCMLRDEKGMSTQDIIDGHIFLTAGGCGPCRFGMYVTEYRKALRDAGFDGFRVLLFQMAGGVKQATGKELGLKIDLKFALTIVRAMIAGDVINILGYRIRPYEVESGATNRALEECKRLLDDTFRQTGRVSLTMLRCRKIMRAVKVDRSQPKPVVSLIGEFWAMTTQGDGNYNMHEFLEGEGAEVDIQGITNWLLFMVWEAGHDTRRRMELREDDTARKGLEGKNPTKKLWSLTAADKAIRSVFQLYANLLGLHNYELPNMQQIADLAGQYYDNDVRGGEGHMEVGKLIHFVEDHVNHMTLSVKPFGCMPSSGVSDGVQSLITAKWPEAIFLPLECSGDGEVNAHSRVQMMLFKARQKARTEFDRALDDRGLDVTEFKRRVEGSWFWRHPFSRPRHRAAGVATNLVYAVS
jgi:predicted nucleotide-binding protein (sugar kinase/HSP70/actin superfamily)